MPTYRFLSEEWIAEARRIAEEHRDGSEQLERAPGSIRMNQVITGVPFGTGTIEAHVDSTSGELVPELGPLDDADVSVTLDYDTAKDIFVDGDMQLAMQAFMAGRIKIEGDISVLLAALQQAGEGGPHTLAQAAHRRIREITE